MLKEQLPAFTGAGLWDFGQIERGKKLFKLVLCLGTIKVDHDKFRDGAGHDPDVGVRPELPPGHDFVRRSPSSLVVFPRYKRLFFTWSNRNYAEVLRFVSESSF